MGIDTLLYAMDTHDLFFLTKVKLPKKAFNQFITEFAR